MNNVFSEFKRGDVWFVKLKTEVGDNVENSSVQRKSRPYLIVSCEQNNNCAPILNVVPITTQKSDHLPMHVYFNNKGRDQIILCEQITTLSVLDFHREGSHFMYSFNIEFMNMIDEALASQLGLRPRVADMKILEKLIDKIAAEKEAELKRKYEDGLQARVETIAAMLSKKFGIELDAKDMLNGVTYRPEQLRYAPKEVQTAMASTAKDRMTPPVADHVCTSNEPSSEHVAPAAAASKRHKSRWDDASMRKFLEDYKHMSVSEMASKYQTTKKSIATYASTFRKRLGLTK